MNLAFVLHTLSLGGGTQKYTCDLTAWLASRGHEVHVYSAVADHRPPGVQVHLLPCGRGPRAWAKAARQVPLDGHDLVQALDRTDHHHVWRAGGGAHAAWLRIRGGVRRFLPRERLELRLERSAARIARLVICNSEMAARDLIGAHALGPDRVRVVRNGVDLERFHPDEAARASVREELGLRGEGRVALFLGTGFRRKGLDLAVAAFHRVAAPEDRLVVCGRDAHAQRWLRPARERLGEQLVVTGPVSDPERWLAGADALLHPTRYDSAANAILEAMACGVAPVTTVRDGAAEIVPDPRLIVEDPEEVRTVAAALRYAWDTVPGAELRGAAEAWPVSRNGEAMEHTYQELVHG